LILCLKLSSNSNHIQGLVDAEKLLRLLEEQKEIVDKPDAKDLVLTDGVIEFRNVEFSYDGKVQAVDGISFTIEKGQSVALVGSSGS
jgi:ABC-type transport system involved in Fe-S cluster assembly fused permease/ATPase subunit